MKYKKSLQRIFILLVALMFTQLNIRLMAKQTEVYAYTADVRGMVCAFCAYSVAKNISQLSGVDGDSVNVDLKAGHVAFDSTEKISEKKLQEIFSDSGFSISHLAFTKKAAVVKTVEKTADLELNIDVFKLDEFSGILEALGNTTANRSARLVIYAPAQQEESILKPLLMGRQQVIKVQYIAQQTEMVKIQLFEPGLK